MKIERKGKVPAEHHEPLNPWRMICIALYTYLKLNLLISCLLSFVKILVRFLSLFLHPKVNFCLLAHLSNICHIKHFIIIAIGPNLKAQPDCVFPHFSLYWLIPFLGSNFLSYNSFTFSYATSLRIPCVISLWWMCSYLELRVSWEVSFVVSRLK